jgi:N-acetylneuraminic acid mutarotase
MNGKLYVVGGWNGTNALGTLEVYDPLTNTWATGFAPLPTPRFAFSVGVVGDTLYTVGGYDSNTGAIFTTVEAYDRLTDTWSTKASLPVKNYNNSVQVLNGILYSIGGGGYNGDVVNTVFAYDPSSNSWSTQPSMLSTRGAGMATGVFGQNIFVVGGLSSADQILGTSEELSLTCVTP